VPAEPATRPPWTERATPMLLLCVAGAFAVYGPALGNAFYNDDALFLNHARRIVEHPTRLFTERPIGFFRPVYSAYVVLQWLLFRLQPAGSFALGIVLHGVTTFLVYRLARRLLRATAPALLAAAAFLCIFGHCEAILWIAAQNTALVCAFAVAAVLLNLRAVERGGWGAALATLLAVLATLYTKEPGVVVLAWIPVVTAAVFGVRRCFTAPALRIFGLMVLALALFALTNGRFTRAVSGDAAPVAESRTSLSSLSASRLLAVSGALLVPAPVDDSEWPWWPGLLLLAAVLLGTLVLRPDLLGAAAASVALLLTGAAPACITSILQANGSRFFYLPTVGLALLVGIVASLPMGPGRTRQGWRIVRPVGAALLLLGCLVHALAIRDLNARDFRVTSHRQTRFAIEVGDNLRAAGDRPVFLLDPPIDNAMHMQEFLQLFQGVAAQRLRHDGIARGRGDAVLAALRAGDPTASFLTWDDEHGLVPAEHLPAAHPVGGLPRSGRPPQPSTRVEVYRIAPP
jgi:hypothetical protein